MLQDFLQPSFEVGIEFRCKVDRYRIRCYKWGVYITPIKYTYEWVCLGVNYFALLLRVSHQVVATQAFLIFTQKHLEKLNPF